jgi:hypothetical protein
MDTARLIGEVYRETGVAVEPGDPVLVSAAINRIVTEEDRAEFRAMLDEIRKVAAESARQPISSETMTELGRTALILVERQVGDLIRYRLRTLLLYLIIGVFAIAGTGFGLGWIAHGSALERECMARGSIQNAPDGKGRFCAFWLPR